jgi:hypothetical protein
VVAEGGRTMTTLLPFERSSVRQSIEVLPRG